MNNSTTITSNDESRKEAKTNYVSDEEVRKTIKDKWGEDLYVAAIDWEAIFVKETEQEGTTSSSVNGGRKRKIRVGSKVSKALNSLLVDPFVTVGAKKENGRFKKSRENQKAKKAENQKSISEEKEM